MITIFYLLLAVCIITIPSLKYQNDKTISAHNLSVDDVPQIIKIENAIQCYE